MATTFYIVRHGKTLFNVLHRYQGHSDSPLTKEGIALAKQLHRALSDIPFRLAASSTSERAVDTMHYILQDRDIPIRLEKDLREVFFGNKEGSLIDFSMPPEEVDAIGYRFCGGENRDEAGVRFRNCLKRLSVEGNVLVITHAAVIFTLLQYIDASIPYGQSDQWIPNCSITKIKYEQDIFTIEEMPTTKYIREDTIC